MTTNKCLCDITLLAEGKSFQAHKVVLASCCKYFQIMFSSGMRETRESEIMIGGVSAGVLSALLDSIYTGRLTVSLDTAEKIVHASSMLLLTDIRDECL